MFRVNSDSIGSKNQAMQFRDFATAMSDCFSCKWSVEPNGSQQRSLQLHWTKADGIAVSRAQMTPVRLLSGAQAASNKWKYCVCYSDQPVIYREEGRTLHIQPGEIFISRPSLPSQWVIRNDYETASLTFDGELFEEFVPNPMAIVGKRLKLSNVVHNTLQAIMDCAWDISANGLFEEAGPKLARSFLEVLSVVAARRPVDDGEDDQKVHTALSARRDQIKAFIRRNYRDPDLSVSMIAGFLKLSPRYVQLALAEDNMTPSDYIRMVRLEECARSLIENCGTGKSITNIAFDSGFNSSSYFSTQFRRHFGISPRSYRAQLRETPIEQ